MHIKHTHTHVQHTLHTPLHADVISATLADGLYIDIHHDACTPEAERVLGDARMYIYI